MVKHTQGQATLHLLQLEFNLSMSCANIYTTIWRTVVRLQMLPAWLVDWLKSESIHKCHRNLTTINQCKTSFNTSNQISLTQKIIEAIPRWLENVNKAKVYVMRFRMGKQPSQHGLISFSMQSIKGSIFVWFILLNIYHIISFPSKLLVARRLCCKPLAPNVPHLNETFFSTFKQRTFLH